MNNPKLLIQGKSFSVICSNGLPPMGFMTLTDETTQISLDKITELLEQHPEVIDRIVLEKETMFEPSTKYKHGFDFKESWMNQPLAFKKRFNKSEKMLDELCKQAGIIDS